MNKSETSCLHHIANEQEKACVPHSNLHVLAHHTEHTTEEDYLDRLSYHGKYHIMIFQPLRVVIAGVDIAVEEVVAAEEDE